MECFIENPNLPSSRVSLAVVDGRITAQMEECLKKKGIRLIKTPLMTELMPAIAGHPDMMLHHLGGNIIIVAANCPKDLIVSLQLEGFKVVAGNKPIESAYPRDIAYNTARVGKFAFCNIKYTDEILLDMLKNKGVTMIDVKQGYAKCSVCIVSPSAIITSDKGIGKAAEANGFDVLVVNPGFIQLKGLDYGFIGGASGFLSQRELGFAGCLEKHPEYININKFLKKHGKNYFSLCENLLTDLGTLLPLKEYSILQA